MRVIGLGFVVAALSLYAWKDWYTSLCGLIVLMAVVEHPDMPRNVFGIPGLNLWNVLFFVTIAASMYEQSRSEYRWDLPRLPAVLLLLGLGVLVCAFLRLLADRQSLARPDPGIGPLVSDYLFNPMKWVALGLLLFHGCRDRRRLVLGLVSILSLYLLLSLQCLRWVVPSGALEGGSLSSYTLNKIRNEVGYHRNDLSVMLAGAFWALLAMRPVAFSLGFRAALVLGSLVVLSAHVLTGGRAGYLAWCVVGLTLGLARWRRYLLLAPLLVVLVASIVPGAAERALEGFHGHTATDSDEIDLDELTAGRNLIWPPVIDKISNAPFLGYGRAAMERTGVTAWLMRTQDESLLEHPHNAYLEMLLDSGVLGLLVTLGLYGTFLAVGFSLARDRRSPECAGAGGVALALVLAQLVGAFTGQSFWPREATVGMWCATGLLLRVWVQSPHLYRVTSHMARSTRDVEWWRRDETAARTRESAALWSRHGAFGGSGLDSVSASVSDRAPHANE